MVSKRSETLELQSVDVQELRLGEPLPGALRDFYGRVLISSGTTLSQAILTRVAKVTGTRFRVFVGPDWAGYEPEPEPESEREQAQASLHQRIIEALLAGKQIHDWSEKRRALRYSWPAQLTLAIEEDDQLTVSRRQVRIRSVDISMTGLGFTYDQFLNHGTVIYAQFDMVPGAPILQGVVRYCHLVRGMTHRVGVEFTPPTGPGKQPA